jgi:hypothetical protein
MPTVYVGSVSDSTSALAVLFRGWGNRPRSESWRAALPLFLMPLHARRRSAGKPDRENLVAAALC